MHLRRYTFAAILLIAAIGIYIHQAITSAEYSLEIMGIHINLPIAVWIVIPMVLLYLASSFHMLYYGFKAYVRRKRVANDIEKLADALFWDILKSPKKHNYMDKQVKPIGAVLDNGCDDFTKVDKKALHELVRDAIDIITAIRHGEVVDLSRYKLDKSNEYVVLNGLNMLKKEPEKVEEILKRTPYYDKRVIHEALRRFVEKANESQIERYIEFIDLEILNHLIETLGERDEKNGISLELIGKILSQIKPEKACDYILLAKNLVKYYKPHELLAFFERLAAQEEKAFRAYLVTLFEFEMLDKASELLQDTQRGEYLDFKAYLDLRRAGKHYPIDLLLKQC